MHLPPFNKILSQGNLSEIVVTLKKLHPSLLKPYAYNVHP